MGEVIYVGRKPVMDYVTATMMQLTESDEVSIKARGRAISKAVDCAEIVQNRFVPDSEISGIETDTDELEDDSGGKRNVSSITIEMRR